MAKKSIVKNKIGMELVNQLLLTTVWTIDHPERL